MSLKIFLSHSSKYKELALSLKLSLQAMECEQHLDISLSEDMAGAKDWRLWIEENVRSSDVFLLLYPHAAMEMGWCNYELGRFYDGKRPIVCIKNSDIPVPPPAFQSYQAYDATVEGLKKFLSELFVEGVFTNGKALNADINNPATDYYARARDVCKVLAARFTEARVKEHLYDRRIVVALHYDDGGLLNRDKTTIEGNPEGLDLLGLRQASVTPWSTVQKSLGPRGGWLTELEAALPAVTTGALPPGLAPYRSHSGLYLPIVVKAESADGIPRHLVVIFVSAGIDRLQPMLGWHFPRAMPKGLKYLVQLVRAMLRSRWEILEPRYQEVRFKSPDGERCALIVQAVLRDYDQMEQEFESEDQVGIGQFYDTFDKDLRPEVQACSDEWLALKQRLSGTPLPPGELSEVLTGLLNNNTRWLMVASRQMSSAVADLSPY